MLGIVQKLLRKEDDLIEYEPATKNQKRRYQRTHHKIWLCGNCGHLYFYAIVKCPLCESRSVKSSVYETGNNIAEDVV